MRCSAPMLGVDYALSRSFPIFGSGFNIAMQDLDIRGAGNLLGAQQSGFIADIGFETYQKIMDEAMAELRQEGFDTQGMSHEESQIAEQRLQFIDDATIEIDVVASSPIAISLNPPRSSSSTVS